MFPNVGRTQWWSERLPKKQNVPSVHLHLNNLPEKMIQPSLFFKHLQAQVQLHMASEGRNVSASLLHIVFCFGERLIFGLHV
jgi:hypothetical protein